MTVSTFKMNMTPHDLLSVSELGLAHVGDAVFELLVRSMLCSQKTAVTNYNLHKLTVRYVSASAQAAFLKPILPVLTEEETAVYKRGRNAHSHAAPKNATPGQYARSTGLETLFGWLYLSGQTERIGELFAIGSEAFHAV